MATISSHTLNGTNGTHAGDIKVTLVNRDSGETLFSTNMDSGGRLNETLPPDKVDIHARYELTFQTGNYWATQDLSQGISHSQLIDEIVLRFQMPDPDARYHMPVILSPNSYSIWSSIPET